MQNAAELKLVTWPATGADHRQSRTRIFAGVMILCVALSAITATVLPLQLSIVTVFLFAGPHNWFEFRYFLMRLPVRFGKSRNFFITAFSGIGVLTIAYIAMPVMSAMGLLAGSAWSNVLAGWNTLLLLWLAALVWQRGRQRRGSDWFWAIPVGLGLSSINWLAPEFFSLAIVYLHPLMALWFLDRHLRRNRREWLRAYRRCLLLVPPILIIMCWQLSQAPALSNDNGLFWRITQHAGVSLLPNISGHLLVSIHLFLEMLHYGVWIVALPLITSTKKQNDRGFSSKQSREFWRVQSIPLARHPKGFPKLIRVALIFGLIAAGVLWLGFSMDYSTTRDIYFTVAIAHVLAEAPFLLKML